MRDLGHVAATAKHPTPRGMFLFRHSLALADRL
jgi:hypothetical protein